MKKFDKYKLSFYSFDMYNDMAKINKYNYWIYRNSEKGRNLAKSSKFSDVYPKPGPNEILILEYK